MGAASATAIENAERTLKRGGMLNPPRTLPYYMLARTCPRCGDLITTPFDKIRRIPGSRLPACRRCAVVRAGEALRELRANDAEFRRREIENWKRRRRQWQAESLPTVRNGHKQWTGPELELAARDDLTVAQIARMLGRSVYAVQHARRKLSEPKWANVAGLGA